jgi:hypothetical protein
MPRETRKITIYIFALLLTIIQSVGYNIVMASKNTSNLTDGEIDILRELAQDTEGEDFTQDDLDAMRENADREIFASIDEMYQSQQGAGR